VASEKKADSEGAHSGTPEGEKENRDNKTVRVTQRSSIRSLVSYVMMRVKAGDTMTVQGLGLGISKAITVASIVRDRLGGIH
jgi:DNA-binding protein